MAPPVASSEYDDSKCAGMLCRYVVHVFGLGIASLLATIIGACIYKARPHGLLLVVVGGSFQMDTSLQGNVTLRFTLRAENPTSGSITFNNISGTLAVLNEYGENEDHFLRFNVTDFNVQQQTFVDSPTQVTAAQLSIANNSIAVVLQLNGTMETSSRNSSAGYRCRIWTNKDDKACSRMKQPIV